MKNLISLVVGLIIAYLVFFVMDPAIVAWVMNSIPASAAEWTGLIKIGVWIAVIMFTGGLGLWLSIVVGVVVRSLIEQY